MKNFFKLIYQPLFLKWSCLGIFCALILFSSFDRKPAPVQNSAYIDPQIGNVAPFLVPTFPTMHQPNQLVRMFPVRKDYLSDEIEAFPMLVYAHRRPGMMRIKAGASGFDQLKQQSMIVDHDLETYQPWLYEGYLIEDDIKISFTPGKKCGIYKIDFQENTNRNLIIQGKRSLSFRQLSPNSYALSETIINRDRGPDPRVLKLRVYAHLEFVDANQQPIHLKVEEHKDWLAISSPKEEELYLKYAVSYISPKQAKRNFKEIKNKDFQSVCQQAKTAWDEKMNQIQVKGGTEAQKRTFFTSLYRTYERMVDITEEGQYYDIYQQTVRQTDQPMYADDWVWDSYRSHHPLRTILNPEQEGDMVSSFIRMYQSSGWMPTFMQAFGNTMCMNSYHSSAIVLDAFNKGIRNFDADKAYQGISHTLNTRTFIPWRQGNPRTFLDDFFHQQGYFPSLALGEKENMPDQVVDDFEKRQPVPVTLGVSYDFWALGKLGEALSKEDHQRYLEFSKNYQKLWHPEHRLFMPKDINGNWVAIDPKLDGGLGYRDYYDENNGWTYAWDVQHDIEGLRALLGGKIAAEKRLDQLFREPLGKRKNQFYVDGSNSTGMVGQFSMGNEPSFHIPYLYNHFGAPWKTQQKTRFLLDTWFKDNIFGIPGDEDGGAMTSFVVFSSLGLYPVTPGIPVYDISSPIFEEASIQLTNGNTFTIKAPKASKRNKYIQSAKLNGKVLNKPQIKHETIMKGGILELKLDSLPNKSWGAEYL
ncbi:GH92 family glycosyl hydrolase [Persicobacter psychrovividus]|uniref:Alpha-1 2-mannosidase n=1 Tax=Persicobacter psychrovividus TaxID=387638 RepID=A0ABM7VLZ7_9BACT|nr:alpha-1 2-mannosidase [Persicobacter psychrovividus]